MLLSGCGGGGGGCKKKEKGADYAVAGRAQQGTRGQSVVGGPVPDGRATLLIGQDGGVYKLHQEPLMGNGQTQPAQTLPRSYHHHNTTTYSHGGHH